MKFNVNYLQHYFVLLILAPFVGLLFGAELNDYLQWGFSDAVASILRHSVWTLVLLLPSLVLTLPMALVLHWAIRHPRMSEAGVIWLARSLIVIFPLADWLLLSAGQRPEVHHVAGDFVGGAVAWLGVRNVWKVIRNQASSEPLVG